MDQDVRQVLNVKIESPFWEEALQKAQAAPAMPQWLTKSFLMDLEQDFSLFGTLQDPVFQAASQVAQTPELCLFAKILYYILEKRCNYSNAFSAFSLPDAPEGSSLTLGYDYACLFPILAHVRIYTRELESRGVSLPLIYDTLTFLRRNIAESCKIKGKPYFTQDCFSIFHNYIYTGFLWFGRLRFEILPHSAYPVKAFARADGTVCLLMCNTTLHASGNILGSIGCTHTEGAFEAAFEETDDYYEGYAVSKETHLAETKRTRLSKAEWKCILEPGDAILKVHIPYGGKLTKADCENAYAEAPQVFQKCFPEYDFKGFLCRSWLLCPLFADFLPKASNIVQFQEKYHIFPAKSAATDVFLYVFNQEVTSADDVEFSQLAEDTSMMRGVKKMLLDGSYFHEFIGFIPI